MNKTIIVDTSKVAIGNNRLKKVDYFHLFIQNCKLDLKENGITACFNLEQVNEIKKHLDINCIEKDGMYLLTLK